MKKQLFIASIEALKQQYEKDLAISKLLGQAFDTKPKNVEPQNQKLINAMVTLLAEMMEDENELIDKFVYECDFGAKQLHTTIDNRIKYINNPAELYTVLESLRIEKLRNELIEDADEIKSSENIFTNSGIYKYFEDLEKRESEFVCKECGRDVKKNFHFSRTVSNGEVYTCNICESEVLVSKKPKEDNY